MTATLIPFPARQHMSARPLSPDAEARRYMLANLSEAALSAHDAITDIDSASRVLWQGGKLGEVDPVLSGETVASFVSATLHAIDLCGSLAADLELRRALIHWLEPQGGSDG